MEQEVLFVEEIVDPEIERETPGRVIVNLRIEHEVILEGSEQVRNGVIQASNIACRCNAPRRCDVLSIQPLTRCGWSFFLEPTHRPDAGRIAIGIGQRNFAVPTEAPATAKQQIEQALPCSGCWSL
jgi:hypothetical protein